MVAGSAAGTFLLLDSLRIWLLSGTTIFGSAGTTDPVVQAGFLALWLVPSILVTAVAKLRWTPVATVAVAVGALVTLNSGVSGVAQLIAACVAALALFAWLVSVAVRGWPPTLVAVGVAVGLAATAVLNLVGGQTDIAWLPAPFGWLVLLAGATSLMLATAKTEHLPGTGGFAPWFAIGPALLLAGVLTTVTSRAWVTGWLGAACVVIGAIAGIPLAAGNVFGRLPWLPLAVLPTLTILTDLLSENDRFAWWGIAAQAGLAAALPAVVAGASGATERTPGIRGAAAYAGLLAFYLLCGTYYAAAVADLPVSRPSLLAVAAILVGLAPALAGRSPRRSTSTRRLLALAPVTVALAWLCAPAPPEPTGPVSTQDSLRVMSYNVRYGVSAGGRYDPAAQAAEIRSRNPDVVLLQEVDRGMLVNGGHDVMAALQQHLGMYGYFTPSNEPLFGTAIFSRRPLENVRFDEVPAYDIPSGAGLFSGIMRFDAGGEIAIGVTHLQEGAQGVSGEQIGDLAALVAGLRDGGSRQVVLGGDFNVEPEDPRLAPLRTELRDALAPARPLLTWPADAPKQQLDHVWVSDGLSAERPASVNSTVSDHLPVEVTVRRSSG
ncbi:endonuclease/exonuclease/phosphatase family protein [Amycolatopsis lurida]